MAAWRNSAPVERGSWFAREAEARQRKRQNRLAKKRLRLESCEPRQMLAGEPVLIAIIPNEGAIIQSANPPQKLDVAPRELTFRFDDGQIIDPTTVGAIGLVRSGGDNVFGNASDVTVAPGFLGIGEAPNEVIMRFASSLPDDLYQVRIAGTGQNPLKNTSGKVFQAGQDLTRVFDLDLGALVLAVVPQPISRDNLGHLSQAIDQIEVYFNNDDLLASSAQNRAFYELIRTNGSLTNQDDTVINPNSVTYDAAADMATLFFNPGQLGQPGTYRLRIGNADPLPVAPTLLTPATDPGSSFSDALALGAIDSSPTGLQSKIVSSRIDRNDLVGGLPSDYVLPFPGAGGKTEIGHRDIQHVLGNLADGPGGTPEEDHLLVNSDIVEGVPLIPYNFKDVIGTDPLGNLVFNLITENQKQLARQIFEFYASVAGVQFVETADLGITVATGDPRAVAPGIPTGPDGALGIAGFGYAIMDAAEIWDDRGPEATPPPGQHSWFQTAMHEIGHLLGMGHGFELPALTIMAGNEDTDTVFSGQVPSTVAAEPVFPGDHDIVHIKNLYRPDIKDIDLYSFSLTRAGTLELETIAQRLAIGEPSTLNTVISVYDGNKRLIARNDDYFSQDSFLKLDLPLGQYYVAVTAAGNTNFDPNILDSGLGGRSEGDYSLHFNFTPKVVTSLVDATGTAFDGDADGHAGGTFNFWFKVQDAAHTVFVDKAAPTGGIGPIGSITNPYTTISTALGAAPSGSIVRIVGNAGVDGKLSTPADALAYNIGFDIFNRPLSDGARLEVPQGVTLMIDAGAVFKLRAANIEVGSSAQGVDRSSGALQVLGVPEVAPNTARANVYFTSYHDETIGKDLDPRPTVPARGDWGGLVFREDSDLEQQGAFLNYVSNAKLNYGGGSVVVNSIQSTYDPIHLIEARPTLINNTITKSADAAISGDPNSFEDSEFQDPFFTADYKRIGPEIHGNTLVDNSINALFVRIRTEAGQPIDKLEVAARFNDTDIVHYLAEALQIQGQPGGPLGHDNPDVPADFADFQNRDPDHSAATVDTSRLNARLAIDPGVVVKLDAGRIEARVGGQLLAEGTAQNRIVFSSAFDDRFGAGGTFDTTNDGLITVPGGTGRAPQPGDWGGLYFGHLASGSVDYALITYAGGPSSIEGGFDKFNAVAIHQADVRLAHSTLEFNADGRADSDRAGLGENGPAVIFVRGAQPAILNNVIRNNVSIVPVGVTLEERDRLAAISINLNALNNDATNDPGRSTGSIDLVGSFVANRGPLVHGNRLANNSLNGMVVRGGLATTQTVWDDTDIVHVVFDTIVAPDFHTETGVRLQSSGTESLVVKLLGNTAGFTAAGRALDIDDRIGGTVQIVGTAGHPVVVTSLRDDSVGAGLDQAGNLIRDTNNDGTTTSPAAGDWRSVRLDEFSNDRNVGVVREAEEDFSPTGDRNSLPSTAEYLGQLATDEKSGDDVLRLGYDIYGAISQASNPAANPAKTGDVDVYSFKARAGTEAWFDIDQTLASLDLVLELVDANGAVVARSNDSTAESNAANDLNTTPYPGSSPLLVGPADRVRVLQNSRVPQTGPASWPNPGAVPRATNDLLHDGDFYTTNPRDPGMRVFLPGTPGALNTYYVRVRANSADLTNLTGGLTAGNYHLQVRLRELDEIPGSTVRYADVRYAVNGIQILGKPEHSPLVTEVMEFATANNTVQTAHFLGNLLTSDRGTLGVAGSLSGEGDIDWYRFTLDYDLIQSIENFSDARKVFPAIFDVDYADGAGRPDLTLSIFDQNGTLLLIARDSNIVDDQPTPASGGNAKDLQAGSFGKLDPYLGSVALPEGDDRTYFVAVSSVQRLPEVLNATFDRNSANPLVRIEPINSLYRVGEEHIDLLPFIPESPPGDPPLDFPGPAKDEYVQLGIRATPFTLSDVTMYATTGVRLITIDPHTGIPESVVTNNLPDTPPLGGQLTYGDIAMRSDGRLFTFTRGTVDANSGVLREINWADGSLLSSTGGGVATNDFDPNTPGPPPGVIPPAPGGVGVQFEAFTFVGKDRMYAVGHRAPGNNSAPFVENILYLIDVNTGQPLLPYHQDNTNLPDVPSNFEPINLIAGSTLFAVDATDVLAPITAPGDIVDGTQFRVGNRTFEFDTGPEYHILNPPGAFGLLDGDTFKLNNTTFEFDEGQYINVLGDGSIFEDGRTLTINDNAGNPGTTRIFEFDSDGNNSGNSGNRRVIPYGPLLSQAEMVSAIIGAIASSGLNVTAFADPGNNRIKLVGTVGNPPNQPTASENSGGLSIGGAVGVTGTNVRIPFEENFTVTQLGTAVATAVDGANIGINAGYRRDRLTFDGANVHDFSGPRVSQVFQYQAGTTEGVTGGTTAVGVAADDSAGTVASKMAAAINAALGAGTATANGGTVSIKGNLAVTADPPLTFAGAGFGGQITGIAQLANGTFYAVTDQGGVFSFDPNATGDINNDGFRDIVLNPLNGFAGVSFSGLSAGPLNVEIGADDDNNDGIPDTGQEAGVGPYANILFATDDFGMLYALDSAGQAAGVLLDSASQIDTGIFGLQGITFSNIDYNLWHKTVRRGGQNDLGHGAEQTFDQDFRREPPPNLPWPGDLSYYFGLEDPRPPDDTQEFQPNASSYINTNEGVFFTYDTPGGSHGSMQTNPFSLANYSTYDRPTLYFNYFLNTEDKNSGDAPQPVTRDALRVFISNDGADWFELATNNETLGREMPAYQSINGGWHRGDTIDQIRQPLFDNTNNWRQARVDLSDFAGQVRGMMLVKGGGTAFADGETFSVVDRFNRTTTFEFNKTGSVRPGNRRVNITDAMTAAEVEAAMATAINAAVGFEATISGNRVNLGALFDFAGEQSDGLARVANDNLRLRFDFSTDGSLNIGAPNVGSYLGAVAGSKLRDGQTIVINAVPFPPVDLTFEFDLGFTLVAPAGAGQKIADGATFTITGPGGTATFEFDKNGDGVAGTNVPIVVADGDSADRVAQLIADAILADGTTGVTPLRNLERVNLLDATDVQQSAGGALAIEGDAPGTLTTPGAYPITAHSAMTAEQVARAAALGIDAGFADFFGTADNPNIFTTAKLDLTGAGNESVLHVMGHTIVDPGPFFWTEFNTDDPIDQFAALPGDEWGAFGAIEGARANRFEGAYIDDIIIGFAERGEMITYHGVTPANGIPSTNTNFFDWDPNDILPNEPPTVVTGSYQLEIRKGTDYSDTMTPGRPETQLYRSFDTNDRQTKALSFTTPSGSGLVEGHLYRISDGARTVTFEMDSDGILETPGALRIGYFVDETANEVALHLRDAINGQTTAKVKASVEAGSSKVDTFGAADIDDGLARNTVDGTLTGGLRDETAGNDTIYTAVDTGLSSDKPGTWRSFGTIGDNPHFDPFDRTLDVDFIKVQANAGDRLRIDIDAGPSTDPNSQFQAGLALQVFYIDPIFGVVPYPFPFGTLALYSSLEAFEITAPGEGPLSGPYLDMQFFDNATFYIGISASFNLGYNPEIDDPADPAFTGNFADTVPGDYMITAKLTNANTSDVVVYDDAGDRNLKRDQGYTVIESNRISNSLGWGIDIRPGTQTPAGDPQDNQFHPGSVANLTELNPTRLVPGIAVTNNLLFGNQVGGIRLLGQPSQLIFHVQCPPGSQIANGSQVTFTDLNGVTITLVANGFTNETPDIVAQVLAAAINGTGTTAQAAVDPADPTQVLITGILSFSTVPANLFQVLKIENVSAAAVPFVRIVNNTIYGISGQTLGIGIANNAGATVLNNIVANHDIGILVETSSVSKNGTDRTVLIGNVYQSNTTLNLTDDFGQPVAETFPIVLQPTDPLFVDATNKNFYLIQGSRAIDSSINTVQERPELQTVTGAVGIGPSPILAPDYDLLGNLRVDDPTVAPPPGQGSNVFKDRGAIDRADFTGPVAVLLDPADNDAAGNDKDPTLNKVLLGGQTVTHFSIQLQDINGIGIDDATVLIAPSTQFVVKRNNVVLQEITDYLVSYDAVNKVVRIDAAAGVFVDGIYTVQIDNTVGTGVKDLANNVLLPNDPSGLTIFTITLEPQAISPWQNSRDPLDVNNDGVVAPQDVIIIVNQLNAGFGGPLPLPAAPPPYYDVNGDGSLTPLDALIIINYLNSLPPAFAGMSGADDGADPSAPAPRAAGGPASMAGDPGAVGAGLDGQRSGPQSIGGAAGSAMTASPAPRGMNGEHAGAGQSVRLPLDTSPSTGRKTAPGTPAWRAALATMDFGPFDDDGDGLFEPDEVLRPHR